MTSVYWRIRRHIFNADHLFAWSNADITFGGDDDRDAAEHLKQAYEQLDLAQALITEHEPVVRYHTVREGRLVGLLELSPTTWVRVRDETNRHVFPVRWDDIEEKP